MWLIQRQKNLMNGTLFVLDKDEALKKIVFPQHFNQPDIKGEGEKDPNGGTDEHGKEDKHHLDFVIIIVII